MFSHQLYEKHSVDHPSVMVINLLTQTELSFQDPLSHNCVLIFPRCYCRVSNTFEDYKFTGLVLPTRITSSFSAEMMSVLASDLRTEASLHSTQNLLLFTRHLPVLGPAKRLTCAISSLNDCYLILTL